MKLSAPKTITWVLAVLLGVVGLLIKLGIFQFAPLNAYAFELELIGLIILVLGTMFNGL
jgi:heme A synthase